MKLNSNIKKIIPAIISIIIFSTVFIFINGKNPDNQENIIQISPKSYFYTEKFGEARSYETSDVTNINSLRNVRINQTSGVSEPKISCNPLNKNILAVSSNDFTEYLNACRLFISEDAGLTWEAGIIPLSQSFRRSVYSDPWLEYDATGNLCFTAVQLDIEKKGRDAVIFTKSVDNGRTWIKETKLVDYNNKENILLDRPKICTRRSASSENTIYITWVEIKGLISNLMYSKSTDGGNTFDPPSVIEKNNVKYNCLAADKNGILFLTYLKDNSRIVLRKSTDAGLTWGKELSYINIIPSGSKVDNQFVLKNTTSKGIRINSEPTMVFSEDNDLLITYSASDGASDKSDIYFTTLKNNSGNLTQPRKVNTDQTDNDQYFPSITTDESGNIIIVYQDSRNDPGNNFTESYFSVSTDGGNTFSDVPLSTAVTYPASVAVERYFGDYISCIVSNGNLIGVWTDGRNNDYDIYAGIISIKDLISNKNQ